MLITRGFKGKERNRGAAEDRVPPGQYVTPDFPVLSAAPTPRTQLEPELPASRVVNLAEE